LSSRPIAWKRESNNVLDEDLTANPYPTWQKLEELVEKGKIRNIGISKYVILLFYICIALAYT
jgi:diketogulonate reductase-like aldo/keto reductase